MAEILVLIPQLATAMTDGISSLAGVLLTPPFNIFLGIALITMGWGLVSKFFKR